MLSGEATHTNFIVFRLTRSGLEPTIYHTLGEHANHYTTDEPTIYHTLGEHASHYTTDEPTIYHTPGEHANHYTTDEPTIYHTLGEHANHYTTDEPTIYHTLGEHANQYTTDAVICTEMLNHTIGSQSSPLDYFIAYTDKTNRLKLAYIRVY